MKICDKSFEKKIVGSEFEVKICTINRKLTFLVQILAFTP